MHLTDEEVAAFANEGSRSNAERFADRLRHLAACKECTERVESRVFDELLADEVTWEVVDEVETHHGSSRLHTLADQIRDEDEAAQQMRVRNRRLSEILSSPYELIWANLSGHRRFRTGGVVRLLTRAANSECERDPLHARNLADAAVAIAEALPPDLYPACGVEHLRGLAWKERANACRYLGDFDDALGALDRAERAFRRLLFPDLHLAIIAFVRSTVLFKMERYDEAMNLGGRAANDFARLGDTLRWAHAQLVIGGVLFETAQFATAREVFARVVEVTGNLGDIALKARAESAMANCEVELGEIGSASMRFLAALPLYEELGMPTEVARIRWSIGCLALRAGNPSEGVRRLRAARDELIRLGMNDDAAKSTLDLVAGLLAVGETNDIPVLLAEALRHFEAGEQVSSVLTATAYAREAALTKRLTPELIDHVRQFVTRAVRHPDLVFIPPPR